MGFNSAFKGLKLNIQCVPRSKISPARLLKTRQLML